MEIYDEAGEVTVARWRRIEKEFESGTEGGFNKETVKDFVFSAVTDGRAGLERPDFAVRRLSLIFAWK